MAPSTRARDRRPPTRREQAAATREALLDATIASLAEVGYDRTTTSEVCERAGLSRGAHLHHFQTRSALLAAAIERLAARGLEQFEREVAQLPTGRRRTAAALDMVWRQYEGQLFQAMLEISVHARTDSELRAALAPLEALLDQPPPLLRTAFGGDGRRDSRAVHDAVVVVLTVVRGLAVMRVLEPDRSIDRAWRLARAQLLDMLEQRGL